MVMSNDSETTESVVANSKERTRITDETTKETGETINDNVITEDGTVAEERMNDETADETNDNALNDTGATTTEGVATTKERTNDETTNVINTTNDSAITEDSDVVEERTTDEGVGMDTLNDDNDEDIHSSKCMPYFRCGWNIMIIKND